jgi:hypothetical protein
MRKVFAFALMLIFFNAGAQEMVTLKFVRPSKFQGSAAKIKIQIQGNEYVIKNGGTISINVPLEYYKSTRIDCHYGLSQPMSIYFKPKPGQVYEFEVGFEFKGMYIRLISGEEARSDEIATTSDSVLVDGKWQKQTIVGKDNLALGFTAQKVDESEAIRQEWLARGGSIMYTSVMLTGVYYKLDLKNYGAMDGYGGGFSANMNLINLKIPEFKEGFSSWNTYNVGLGYDMMIYAFKYGFEQAPIKTTINSATMTMLINLNIGWTLGLGKFLDRGNWKGVALTLKYRPSFNLNYTSYTMTMKSSEPLIPDYATTDSDTQTQFNAGGVGFDLDFTSYSATMNKLAPKPKAKLSFFILPPIGDNPLFISISLGVSMYKR